VAVGCSNSPMGVSPGPKRGLNNEGSTVSFLWPFHLFAEFSHQRVFCVFLSDLLGARQCCCGDNLPSHCQRRPVQEQRRSWFTDGQRYFNVYQHCLYHDYGKGKYNQLIILIILLLSDTYS